MKWPLVTRKTAERMRVETRRNLIDHLRQNSRGLILLDNAHLSNITAPGPITILGERATLTGSMFLSEGANTGR